MHRVWLPWTAWCPQVRHLPLREILDMIGSSHQVSVSISASGLVTAGHLDQEVSSPASSRPIPAG